MFTSYARLIDDDACARAVGGLFRFPTDGGKKFSRVFRKKQLPSIASVMCFLFFVFLSLWSFSSPLLSLNAPYRSSRFLLVRRLNSPSYLQFVIFSNTISSHYVYARVSVLFERLFSTFFRSRRPLAAVENSCSKPIRLKTGAINFACPKKKKKLKRRLLGCMDLSTT